MVVESILIDDLGSHLDCIPEIARWQFDVWGRLTGAESYEQYIRMLEACANGSDIPAVLVALFDGILLGSASLVSCDMKIRPALTPWLAQLFVLPPYRQHGVGRSLVRALAARAKAIGYRRLYLFTSGDLPQYYERLRWITDEQVEYIGKKRTVMHLDICHASSSDIRSLS
jgi:GNAT superfamily N-acetyltransferase